MLLALPTGAYAVSASRYKYNLLYYINRYRIHHGLHRLRINDHLQTAAQAHSLPSWSDAWDRQPCVPSILQSPSLQQLKRAIPALACNVLRPSYCRSGTTSSTLRLHNSSFTSWQIPLAVSARWHA